MLTNILEDVFATATDLYPLPDFKNETAVLAWLSKLAADVGKVVYDVVGTTTTQAKFAISGPTQFTDAEVETAWNNALCRRKAAGRVTVFGDGQILKFLQSINWAQLIQTIITIISIIPKQPVPTPTPAPPTT